MGRWACLGARGDWSRICSMGWMLCINRVVYGWVALVL
jgi:hypothetical protein